MSTDAPPKATPTTEKQLDRVTIRFAGDSGDGMQLTGTQFTRNAAAFGNDISTFPDYPAEIRAPAGSLPGVSGFQLSFSSSDIHTPGDAPDVLVAMNPAALKANIGELPAGCALIVNEDAFTPQNLTKVGYASNPLNDGSLKQWNVFSVPVSTLNGRALDGLGLTNKQVDLTKNFFALGLMFWLYERDMAATLTWIDQKFCQASGDRGGQQARAQGGLQLRRDDRDLPRALRRCAGEARARALPEHHRQRGDRAGIRGCRAARGPRHCSTARTRSRPRRTSSTSSRATRTSGVKTFQAEDEIAAIGAAIGASYGGAMGLTASSGPGIALKSEALGLAVMVELPLVVVDVQRAGPSTGMPTKNEQADLLQVMFGRNSDSPVVVVAPATPGECFHLSIEAWRLALKYMTPVVYLSDAFLANGAEPWRIPNVDDLPSIAVPNRTEREGFYPYLRDETTLARPWAVPGTPGLEHRIGGLEKADIMGNVSYDPDNHHRMQLLRQAKIAGIAADIPPLEVYRTAGGRSAGARVGFDLRSDPQRRGAPAGAAGSRSPMRTCAT